MIYTARIASLLKGQKSEYVLVLGCTYCSQHCRLLYKLSDNEKSGLLYHFMYVHAILLLIYMSEQEESSGAAVEPGRYVGIVRLLEYSNLVIFPVVVLFLEAKPYRF
ncbi:uncharacterized protein HD556DRAFT_1406654 [Suillus plorans]|uniref:Uncharacterized protein n=1 Tax=Suillus plorans TaxID=116603 RepID=A0A9P7DDG5_9AGAM|nr:uncharacterized protein HD556DRAFT_1406654 [Suillus plorans]KAG1787960.1 hypothetical protein HD556DRAFT_1406654 [Suillus plorans]